MSGGVFQAPTPDNSKLIVFTLLIRAHCDLEREIPAQTMKEVFLGMVKKLRFAIVIVVALAVALSAGGAAVGSKKADPDKSARLALTEQEGEEKGEQEEAEGEEDQKNLAAQAKISEEQAKEAAEKATGGTATEVELDEQNG